MDILLTRDTKGKIRVVEMNGYWSDTDRGYFITRETYQYGGKHLQQPLIFVQKGKASRTVTEQFKLEYNSKVKKYLDKGYKRLPDNIDINNQQAVEDFIASVIPDAKTDSNGFKKHMLAKQADTVASKTFDAIPYWYGSRKVDGVRLSLYWQDDHIETASRGGQKYSCLDHITKHPKLIEFFKKHPDYVLDGELYKHGLSLQQISGYARREKEQSPILEYYIYDLMDDTLVFRDRLTLLNEIKEELNLDFNPEREWNDGDLKLQMLPHEKVTGWLNIEKLHNKYVKEGWEGLVIRDPDAVYTYGGRTKDMIKVKNYDTLTARVVGIKPGLRPIEDMVFEVETLDTHIRFLAKPWGSLEIKEDYYNNFDKEYKGHLADFKYFYLSDTGVPLQPSMISFRFDLEPSR